MFRRCAVAALVLCATLSSARAEEAPAGVIQRIKLPPSRQSTATYQLSDGAHYLVRQNAFHAGTTIELYDVLTGRCVFKAERLARTKLSADGRFIATVSREAPPAEPLRIISLAENKVVFSSAELMGPMCYFDENGRRAYVVSTERVSQRDYAPVVRAVNLADGRVAWKIALPNLFSPADIRTSADGSRVAMLGGDRASLLLCNAADGAIVEQFQWGSIETIRNYYLSPDGTRMVAVNWLGGMTNFDLATGAGRKIFAGGIGAADVSPDFHWAVAALTAVDLNTGVKRQLSTEAATRGQVISSGLKSISVLIQRGEQFDAVTVVRLPPIERWPLQESAAGW